MAPKTVAEAVAEVLELYGVEVVFGIPGIHILEMCEAVGRSQSLRHVLMRHEQGAGFAADGYARASGSPGVCLTTTGPGATNTLTPLCEAYADSVPVVVLSGQIDSHLIGLEKGVLHEIRDQEAMFRPVTKFSASPRTAASVPKEVAAALAAARSGRPRPCYVELPTDLLGQPGTVPGLPPGPAPPAAPGPGDVGRAAQILAAADRPVLLAGGGSLWGEGPEAVLRLAEKLSAPVLSTVQGNGVIPGDHRLCAGCIHPDYGGARPLLEQSDAILVVGSQLDAETTGSWRLPLRNIVQIDIDPAEPGRNYPVEAAVVADASEALVAIESELPQTMRSSWSPGSARAAFRRTLASAGPALSAESRMMQELRRRLPRETVLVSDQAIVNAWTAWFWTAYEPRTQLFPWGGASLGYGLPAAIGASLAEPDRPIVAVAGDGGFMFTVAELATCAKYQLNVTSVVVNNNAYGSIAYSQRDAFGHDGDTALTNPDFVQLARSFGIPARQVAAIEDVAGAVAAAVAEPGPGLVEVTAPIRQPWSI